jgi:hypothetical protein
MSKPLRKSGIFQRPITVKVADARVVTSRKSQNGTHRATLKITAIDPKTNHFSFRVGGLVSNEHGKLTIPAWSYFKTELHEPLTELLERELSPEDVIRTLPGCELIICTSERCRGERIKILGIRKVHTPSIPWLETSGELDVPPSSPCGHTQSLLSRLTSLFHHANPQSK